MEKLLTRNTGTIEEFLTAAQTAAERAAEKAEQAKELAKRLEVAPQHGEVARTQRQITAECAANCYADARHAANMAADYAAWAREAADALGAPEAAADEAELTQRLEARSLAWDTSGAWCSANWSAWRARVFRASHKARAVVVGRRELNPLREWSGFFI